MRVNRKGLAVFGGGVGAVAVATAVARVACPAGCATCESCVASVAPMGAGLLTLGGVLFAGRRMGRDRVKSTDADRRPGAAAPPSSRRR